MVAKHDLYFPFIRRAIESLQQPHTTTYAKEFEELSSKEQEFDYVFFPHYSRLIPKEFYSRFVCIGFHIGNLPKDRGGSPIQNKILMGEYKTFVNAFQIDESIDGGPLLDKKEIDLETGDIVQILERAAETIASMIANIVSSKPKPSVQINSPVRFHRLTQKDSRVNFEQSSLKQIFDRIRMVDGLDYPKAEVYCPTKIIRLSKANLKNGVLTFECEVRDDIEER